MNGYTTPFKLVPEVKKSLEIKKPEPIRTETVAKRLFHKGFLSGSIVQEMVDYAYKKGGVGFVKMLDCENGEWEPNRYGDNGDAFGLCQMNKNFHKIPSRYYEYKDWKFQIDYCQEKFKGGTKFYGPNRKTKNTNYMKCSDFVSNRFIFVN